MDAFVARVPRATRSRFPRYNTARATLLNGEFRVGSYCVVAAARGIVLIFFFIQCCASSTMALEHLLQR